MAIDFSALLFAERSLLPDAPVVVSSNEKNPPSLAARAGQSNRVSLRGSRNSPKGYRSTKGITGLEIMGLILCVSLGLRALNLLKEKEKPAAVAATKPAVKKR